MKLDRGQSPNIFSEIIPGENGGNIPIYHFILSLVHSALCVVKQAEFLVVSDSNLGSAFPPLLPSCDLLSGQLLSETQNLGPVLSVRHQLTAKSESSYEPQTVCLDTNVMLILSEDSPVF